MLTSPNIINVDKKYQPFHQDIYWILFVQPLTSAPAAPLGIGPEGDAQGG